MMPTLTQMEEATILGRWLREIERADRQFGPLPQSTYFSPDVVLGSRLQLLQCYNELAQLLDAPIATSELPSPPYPWRARGNFGDGEVWEARWQGSSWRVIRTVSQQLDGRTWAHVSASRYGQDRLPTWPEMSAIKSAFLGNALGAIQVHPPRSQHINLGEVLHLWAPLEGSWPLPDFAQGGISI